MAGMTLPRSKAGAGGTAGRPTVVATIRTDNLLMFHYIGSNGAEIWDIAYSVDCVDADIAELVDLEDELLRRYGRRLDELVVKRLDVARPHPDFVGSKAFTYVRISPIEVL
ncbi:hypothetical protein ACIQC7_09035 [Kitasatospora sp. NPDC088556]|uniref:hypothetical protein n=1 Tax=Kitasatospora sp. NPDC088556 TaxID=3364076 RepID=UPI0037F7D83B